VLLSRIGAVTLLLFGLYVVLHGTVTPGGGFQGGVIIATALMLVFLGEGYPAWRSVARGPVLAALEGGGALAFVLAAATPLALGRPALANILPFGTWKDLYSGGLMVVANAAVGMAVTGSFGLILLEFLEETRGPETDDLPDEADA
jgi:multicomponent Na+:H+ antiporter subunit B